ncbi:unnamed protein product, partial [Meganyctiphanes norvegica]
YPSVEEVVMDIHVLLYFVGLCFPKLSESVCNYRQIANFKQKYFRDYNGKDIPEIRCDKLGGHCLRYKEKCNGRNEFWQTSCDHECDCCLKVGSRRRERTKQWLLMRRKLNWKDAEEYCEVKRGDLLVPENVWDLIEFLRHEDIADTSAAYGKGVRIGKERKSWSDARKDCQANGGDLHIPAYIVDMVLYMRKLDIGSRDVWIGYSDHYDAEKYVGIQGNEIEGG